VYRRYAPYVATIALRILGDASEADDLVQDVFLVAHRSLSTVEHPERLRGWLATIAVRKSLLRLRRARVRRWLSLDDGSSYENLAEPSVGPDKRVEVARLYRELDLLGAKERVIWILKHLEGHTLEEVVERTGLSKSTVQRRLRKAEAHFLRRRNNG
jgi:RNA polymerase sigma-70 factor (ECF subfamily)